LVWLAPVHVGRPEVVALSVLAYVLGLQGVYEHVLVLGKSAVVAAEVIPTIVLLPEHRRSTPPAVSAQRVG
jgi:hypothetical protein